MSTTTWERISSNPRPFGNSCDLGISKKTGMKKVQNQLISGWRHRESQLRTAESATTLRTVYGHSVEHWRSLSVIFVRTGLCWFKT